IRGSTSSSYRTPSIVMLTLVIRPPRRPTWADVLSFPQAHLRAKPRTPLEPAPVPGSPARRGLFLVHVTIRTHAGATAPTAISVGTLRLGEFRLATQGVAGGKSQKNSGPRPRPDQQGPAAPPGPARPRGPARTSK